VAMVISLSSSLVRTGCYALWRSLNVAGPLAGEVPSCLLGPSSMSRCDNLLCHATHVTCRGFRPSFWCDTQERGSRLWMRRRLHLPTSPRSRACVSICSGRLKSSTSHCPPYLSALYDAQRELMIARESMDPPRSAIAAISGKAVGRGSRCPTKATFSTERQPDLPLNSATARARRGAPCLSPSAPDMAHSEEPFLRHSPASGVQSRFARACP
jgi:hypothetical protein